MTKEKFTDMELNDMRGEDLVFARRYLKIDRADIAYLRFTLEAYDGLGFFRTVDNEAAIVELSFPPSQGTVVEALLSALQEECPLIEVPQPGGLQPL